jgi:hypothetical protein
VKQIFKFFSIKIKAKKFMNFSRRNPAKETTAGYTIIFDLKKG